MFPHLGGQGKRAIDAVRVQDVVENRQVVQQGKVLEHKAHVGNAKASPAWIVQLRQSDAVNRYAPVDRRHDAGEQIDERGLARSAGADNGHFLPGIDFQLREC